jgi:tRNA threonylcarbamoyl adenosine modification protein YeaZ
VILLALESAASSCSVALCDDAGGVLGHRSDARGAGQADRLVELIDAALGAAGVRYQDLDLIAVNHGPGSFTGVRAGVAAARALAQALARPVIAVNTLEVLAATVGARPAGTVIAALDARRGQVYVQTFDHRLVALGAASALAPEEMRLGAAAPPLYLVGSGAGLLGAALPNAPVVLTENAEADAVGVARRALARLAAGERPVAGRAVRPLYLRPPDARLPGSPRAHASASVGA